MKRCEAVQKIKLQKARKNNGKCPRIYEKGQLSDFVNNVMT
jgi:hypothetical protein